MLTPTLLRTGLRDLLRRPLHTGLMIVGVALGVAVVIAIDLANSAARRGFLRSAEAIVGRATHQVVGGPGGLDQDVLRRIRVEAGVRTSAPVIDEVAVAVDLERQPLHVLGIDPLSESAFRGNLGGTSVGAPGFAALFTDPRAVVVGVGLAERYGLTLGGALRLQVAERVETLRVIGILTPGDPDARRALDGLVFMDIGAAQRLFRREGRVTRIDLVATPAELTRITPLLPPGARIAPASEQADTSAQLSAAFQLNLTALSLLALVVGMFLIYNTVMFGVVQRRAVFGTLRVLGATPRQVFALILVEAASAAALGTALGLGLGYVLGQAAVRLVTQTINDLYYVLAVRGAALSPGAIGKGVLLGIGAGVLAALAPALEAARVEPVVALRPSTFEAHSRRLLPGLTLAGVVVALAGTLALALSERSLALSFGGLFGLLFGFALLSPIAMVLLVGLAARITGTLGRLAARSVTRAVSRTGVAVAALMVAVSVTIGVTLMIGSFRATVVNWLELTLPADIYIGGLAAGAGSAPSLAPEWVARVSAVPGVARVETVRVVDVAGADGAVHVAVTDARSGRDARLFRVAERAGEAWARVLAGDVLVTEPFAHRHRLPARGGEVTLLTDRGPHTFAVAGVYYDYATERGTVLIHRDVYDRWWDDRAISSLAAYVTPGANVENVADALRTALRGTTLQVSPNASLRRTALKIFDRTFAVTQALRLLAVVVAFIGVWSALMALQVERRRELATLQALGLTLGQLWKLTLLETGLMGAAAGLLSWPTGAILAWVLVNVINLRSFGWTMTFEFAPWVFVQALVVAVLAALLAGVYPLLRLARIPVAAALRQE